MLPSITPRSTLQAAIDFSPMTDSENFNNNRPVINGVQNAVIPYSRPVPFFTLQFLDPVIYGSSPRDRRQAIIFSKAIRSSRWIFFSSFAALRVNSTRYTGFETWFAVICTLQAEL